MNDYKVEVFGLNEYEKKAFQFAINKADEAKKWVDALKVGSDAYDEAVVVYAAYLAAVKYFVAKSN